MFRIPRSAAAMVTAVAATLATAVIPVGAVHAQAFPSRPIRVVVPFPPGGGTDVVVRTVAPHMAEVLGQQIVVDNRAGAGGNIGTDAVAKAPADGYTLLAASAATAINSTLSKNIGWNATRDFAPVVLLVINQSLLVVHPSVAAKNVRELLALAKSRPGKLTFASYGNGSSAHLVGELFKMSAGVDLVHVPYKGAAPAVGDLLGGQVDMLFADVAAVLPHVKSGKLVPLGIGSAKRFDGLPDVPTIAESGVPGFEGGGFIGLVAPAGTPKAIVDALNAAALKGLATSDVRDRLNGLASPPVGESPEFFTKFIRTETDKWAKVIAAGRITAD